MPKYDNPLAILVSDIHLQHTCPPARAAEPSWYGAMERRLHQLRQVQIEASDAPIIYAGDIFDRWNSPAELINFALRTLPEGYSIPGQHDLPHHSLEGIERTAYTTLVHAGKLHPILTSINSDDYLLPTKLTAPYFKNSPELFVYGFPWGCPIFPLLNKSRNTDIHLAVIHAYIWMESCGYPGAPEDKKIAAYRNVLKTYSAAMFGDNHKGFLSHASGVPVLNCGAFIPRRSDERYYAPAYGLLFSDGVIERHFFDTSEDKWTEGVVDAVESYEQSEELAAYLESLKSLESDFDYREACQRAIEDAKVSLRAAKLIRKALDQFLAQEKK